jgi:hypothetical protein
MNKRLRHETHEIHKKLQGPIRKLPSTKRQLDNLRWKLRFFRVFRGFRGKKYQRMMAVRKKKKATGP